MSYLISQFASFSYLSLRHLLRLIGILFLIFWGYLLVMNRGFIFYSSINLLSYSIYFFKFVTQFELNLSPYIINYLNYVFLNFLFILHYFFLFQFNINYFFINQVIHSGNFFTNNNFMNLIHGFLFVFHHLPAIIGFLLVHLLI